MRKPCIPWMNSVVSFLCVAGFGIVKFGVRGWLLLLHSLGMLDCFLLMSLSGFSLGIMPHNMRWVVCVLLFSWRGCIEVKFASKTLGPGYFKF